MGLVERISRLTLANINDLASKAEDPEKILEHAVIDMQEDLIQLRQAVAQSIASQKRTEQQYSQNQSQANTWQQRAQLALQKNDETLARQALERKKGYMDAANALKAQLDSQSGQVDTLKRSLIGLEGKISEAKTKKNMLKARAQAAKAQEQLQSAVSNIGTSSAMGAITEMQDELILLYQDMVQSLIRHQQLSEKQNHNKSLSLELKQQFQAALIQGDVVCASQALERDQETERLASTLETQLEIQNTKIRSIKPRLASLKRNIEIAKTHRKAEEAIGLRTAMGAFERMEEKVLNQEARAQAAHELAGADLEIPFFSLEAGSDVEDELEEMKRRLGGAAPNQATLPASEIADAAVQSTAPSTAVDAELEELKKQLDGL